MVHCAVYFTDKYNPLCATYIRRNSRSWRPKDCECGQKYLQYGFVSRFIKPC